LRVHTLDLILSNIDVPADETGEFAKAQVGRLPVCFVAAPAVARRAGPFPACLSKVPLLLPTRASPIWTGVEHFLSRHRITPQILAEAQGVELLRLMACEGMGVAPLNTIAALGTAGAPQRATHGDLQDRLAHRQKTPTAQPADGTPGQPLPHSGPAGPRAEAVDSRHDDGR
jgi:hypothetical protein